MYRFRIPIGDWSGDGHNQCEWYLIHSNKSVEEVREVHYLLVEVFPGLEDGFFSSYGDYEDGAREEDIKSIKNLGLDPTCYMRFHEKDNCFCAPAPKKMAELWIDALMQMDQSLKLSIIEEKASMLTFYGQDEEGRHIHSVGYGLFSGDL